MAIGLARMFGFRFQENFIYPLSSKSMKEFWTRWHISLSAWFRDYVYFSLGGSRKGFFRTQLNLWIIFLLMGLWHGAEWTFIAFGAWHGIFIVLERSGFEKILARVPVFLRNGYVWIIYMTGNIIFSSPDMGYAARFISALFTGAADTQYSDIWLYIHSELWFVMALGILFHYPVAEMFLQRFRERWTKNKTIFGTGRWALWSTYMLLLVLCMAAMAGSTYNPFIYFRF
jgi:alginate O-acetyltransferase complex protein AlgI